MGSGTTHRAGRRQLLVLFLQVGAVAGAYVLGAHLGLSLAFENRNVTAFWPPTGIAVAALLAWGGRVWPGVAIGAFVANVANGTGPATAALITIGNTIAPLVAAELLRRVFGLRQTLDRVRDVLALFFIGGIASMTISASAGTAVLWRTGAIGKGTIASVWLVWWVGDAIGVALFAPFLLLTLRRESVKVLTRRPLEAIALLIVTALFAFEAFDLRILLPYIVFVPVVWAALRFRQTGAAVVAVLITGIAVAATVAGRGPFSFLTSTENLVSLQTFNATIAFASLLMAAAAQERRRAETALRSSEELYRELFERAKDFVCIADTDGRITFANAAAEQITGYTRDRLHAMTIQDLVAPEHARVVRQALQQQISHLSAPSTHEVDVVGTAGRRVTLEMSTTRVYDGTEPSGVQFMGRDITWRRLAEDQLRHRALRDDLTGLPNETLLRERLDYAIEVAKQSHNRIALLLVDPGSASPDTPFDIGDNAAVAVPLTKILERLARGTDVVARINSDEFAFLLTPIETTDDAEAIAERIVADARVLSLGAGAMDGRPDEPRDPLREPLDRDASRGVSVGIALFPDHADRPDDLVRKADVALYVAKQRGGDTHVLYGPDHAPDVVRRAALLGELPDAIEQDQLQLLFQPKISVETLNTVGVECHIRWTHPIHGQVPAPVLLAAIDDPGLRTAVTAWTIRESMRRCAIWLEAGLELSVAVNVSARQLRDATIVDELRNALDETNVPVESFIVEIAENDLTDGSVRSVLGRLTDLGIRLSVDHFGTGHTSVVPLRELALAEIKLDPTLVARIDAVPEERRIARSIIELGHNLGVPIVADGVETRQTWSQLSELGCDIAQGPLISDPLPANELESWLRTPAWSTRFS